MQLPNKNTNDCWLFTDFWNKFYEIYINQQDKKSKRDFFKIAGITKDKYYRAASKCSWLEFPNKLRVNSILFCKFVNHDTIMQLLGFNNLTILINEFAKITNIGTAKWTEVVINKMKKE